VTALRGAATFRLGGLTRSALCGTETRNPVSGAAADARQRQHRLIVSTSRYSSAEWADAHRPDGWKIHAKLIADSLGVGRAARHPRHARPRHAPRRLRPRGTASQVRAAPTFSEVGRFGASGPRPRFEWSSGSAANIMLPVDRPPPAGSVLAVGCAEAPPAASEASKVRLRAGCRATASATVRSAARGSMSRRGVRPRPDRPCRPRSAIRSPAAARAR
jgi:hypothetical protein